MKNLNKILARLEELRVSGNKINYHIPSLWQNPTADRHEDIVVSPIEFFIERIKTIIDTTGSKQLNTTQVFVYNMFIRYTTTYDHNHDGKISVEQSESGFRETGTFLKAIALLPYIRALGCNTVYLLPITSIGKYGKKGNLGSPYAIADHYKLDENLNEPILDISVEDQFKAFVEAAHHIGIKVIIEFVFRTASVDSPTAIKHPEWFYWIKEEIELRMGYTDEKNKFGPPFFKEKELALIYEKIRKNDLSNLPAPTVDFKKLFTNIPTSVAVEDGKMIGITKDGQKVKIASAFADWPPDDNQPVWSDVTYLKIFDNPKFNYIAYNTIRMYDDRLSVPKNMQKSLWEYIIGIIPYYQEKYEIDGVMIDMGHALPDELLARIIKKARANDGEFILWEENFQISESSATKGFNASLGYMPFDSHIPEKLRKIIKYTMSGECPMDFFLTSETHNTKRAAQRQGGIEFSMYIWTIISLINGIKFIHSGFELGETAAVNCGLQFTDNEIQENPPSRLPLFSSCSMDWNRNARLIPDIMRINEFVQQLGTCKKISAVKSLNPQVLSYIFHYDDDTEILLIAADFSKDSVNTILFFNKDFKKFEDIIDERKYYIQNREILIEMSSHQVVLGLIEQ